ncbi:MAG TPA: hypothetical protein ENG98_02080 [Actinobacteria bacterium]|nr:hypothetical protein [Actinomycetota bacterium]
MQLVHVRNARAVVVLVAIGAVLATGLATAAPRAVGDSSGEQEAPVAEDAIQPSYDNREMDGGLGPEEKLPFIDMSRPDGPAAQGYAAAHSISPEAASDVIRWQSEVIKDLKKLAPQLGDRYAGSTFLHPDDSESGLAEVLVYVYEPSEQDEIAVESMSGVSQLVPSAVTNSEALALEELAASVAREANPDSDVDVEVDFESGDVAITVYDSLGGQLDLVCSPSSTKTGGKLDGGRGFLIKWGSDSCVKHACTLGFSGYFNSKQGALTAAHCVDSYWTGSSQISYKSNQYITSGDSDWWIEAQCHNSCNPGGGFEWAALRPYYADWGPDDDVAFVREKYASTQPSDNIYVADVGFYNVYGFESGNIFPPTNTVLCQSASKFAVNPGESCGEVSDWIDYSCCNWVSTTQNWTEVDYYSGQFGGGGSSGGPWYRYFNSSNVIGMGTHSSSNTTQTRGYYERVDKAFDAIPGLKLYCDYGYGIVKCSPWE